jgi:DNA mismatch repair ATPase MutS
MHVEDDVSRGASHFLVEAETSRDMLLESMPAGITRLCIIDELFRGTNTADRVAAAAALLRALHRRGAVVVAATHDAELVTLLGRDYCPHFFQESITAGKLEFDYLLREGPVAPRNALAVLALVGFPPDVIAEAENIARPG